MLDFGWAELIVIMAIAVLVIGPQDIPKIMYQLGRIVRRLQYVKFAFSRQFEEFMQTHDLQELHDSVNFEARESSAPADEAAMDEMVAEETIDKHGGLDE